MSPSLPLIATNGLPDCALHQVAQLDLSSMITSDDDLWLPPSSGRSASAARGSTPGGGPPPVCTATTYVWLPLWLRHSFRKSACWRTRGDWYWRC